MVDSFSCVIIPVKTIKSDPNIATTVLLIFSLAIKTYIIIKIIPANKPELIKFYQPQKKIEEACVNRLLLF